MAAKVDPSSDTSASRSHASGHADASRIIVDVPSRLRSVLARLLASHEAARNSTVTCWELSDALTALRRAGGENNDLRWLVRRGLVDHAVLETPQASAARTFRLQSNLRFSSNSRFVLTPAGVQVARELIGAGEFPGAKRHLPQAASDERIATVAAPPARRPHWDRNRGELVLGSAVVKRLTLVTADEDAILAAFEELAWPVRIDNPLGSHSDAPARLRRTVRALNRQRLQLIRFQEDEGASGVRWNLLDDNPPHAG